jgi:hypothetical protein
VFETEDLSGTAREVASEAIEQCHSSGLSSAKIATR